MAKQILKSELYVDGRKMWEGSGKIPKRISDIAKEGLHGIELRQKWEEA